MHAPLLVVASTPGPDYCCFSQLKLKHFKETFSFNSSNITLHYEMLQEYYIDNEERYRYSMPTNKKGTLYKINGEK